MGCAIVAVVSGGQDRLHSFVHSGGDAVDLLATLTADGEPLRSAAPATPLVELGQSLGRYIVLGTLGSGGMGVVVAAYDPELDRRVAIKVLRPEYWQLAGEDARRLLQREAMLMARLSHANIG